MLNMMKAKLELVTNPDMHLFFEKGIRGGVSYVSKSIVNSTISIWNVMIQNKNQNILYNMVMWCLRFF